MLGGLVNSVTHSAAKPIQQDAAFHLALPGVKLVAVADGISGRAYLTRSQEASQLAVHAFLAAMLNARCELEDETISEEVIRSAFAYAHNMVRWLGSTTPDNPP